MNNNEYYTITTLESEHPGRNRLSTFIVTGLAGVAILGAAKGVETIANHATVVAGPDTCTDGGHQLLDLDGQSFDQIANEQKALRKYDMDGTGLAQANPTLAELNPVGGTDSKIRFKGKVCLTLTGPQVPGIIRVDGKTTVSKYAAENYLTLAQLKSMNPGVSAASTQVLPRGKILKVAKNPDMSLFMREMTEPDLRTVVAEIYPDDLAKQKALSAKIKTVNTVLDDGKALAKGVHAFLPPVPDKDNPELGKENVTNAAIELEYADTYKKLGVDQVVAPQVKKPLKVASKPASTALQKAKKMAALGGKWGREGKLMLRFLKLDLSPVQACGAIGSMDGESGLEPQRVQNGFAGGPLSQVVPDSIRGGKGGYGVAQWTSEWRVDYLESDAAKHHEPVDDFDFQADHIIRELTRSYPKVLTELRSAHTIPQATDVWTFGYENPGVPHEARRIRLTQSCIDEYDQM